MIQALQTKYGVRILSGDDARRTGPWQKPWRRLTWYLLVCSMDGEEQISVHGERMRIREGESYLIAPGVKAELASAGGNRPVWVHFEAVSIAGRGEHPAPRYYEDDWAARKPWAQPGPREVWGVNLPVRVPAVLQGMFAEGLVRVVQQWREGRDQGLMESRHRLEGLLLAWVGMERGGDATPSMGLRARIERAENLAREQTGGIFGVKELAAAAGLSRSRFSVLYQRERGRGPGEFLRKLRLEEAARLLRRTELGVSKIGRLCGYADAGVFGRAFRREYGKAPGTWRKAKSQTS